MKNIFNIWVLVSVLLLTSCNWSIKAPWVDISKDWIKAPWVDIVTWSASSINIKDENWVDVVTWTTTWIVVDDWENVTAISNSWAVKTISWTTQIDYTPWEWWVISDWEEKVELWADWSVKASWVEVWADWSVKFK